MCLRKNATSLTDRSNWVVRENRVDLLKVIGTTLPCPGRFSFEVGFAYFGGWLWSVLGAKRESCIARHCEKELALAQRGVNAIALFTQFPIGNDALEESEVLWFPQKNLP